MRTVVVAGTAGLMLALFSANAFADQNPNVSSSSPYALGAYDVNAPAGIGAGFDHAVMPGKVVGVILTPLTMVPAIFNNVSQR